MEYYYRYGRINDELGRDIQALSFYQKAVETGKNERYYFAANSALQTGKIYEKQRNVSKARQAYNTILQMKNFEYESSIKNQAKAGLNRLK